jgi:cathepsin A (carboxypeptidase C)
MKLVVASALMVGAASAAIAPQQQILAPEDFLRDTVSQPIANAFSKSLHTLGESLKGFTSEAKALWDEVALIFPEEVDKASFFSSPKPHTRKHDNEWDFVIKGADIQSIWVENAKGEKEREVEGRLENYNLRTKSVDPSKLGVDTVKQYSGYLDDEENDKHLFYCKFNHPTPLENALNRFRVL